MRVAWKTRRSRRVIVVHCPAPVATVVIVTSTRLILWWCTGQRRVKGFFLPCKTLFGCPFWSRRWRCKCSVRSHFCILVLDWYSDVMVVLPYLPRLFTSHYLWEGTWSSYISIRARWVSLLGQMVIVMSSQTSGHDAAICELSIWPSDACVAHLYFHVSKFILKKPASMDTRLRTTEFFC